MSTEPVARPWRGVLRDRRVWALGFVVLLIVPSFFLLARWQLHRLDERREVNTAIEVHTQEPAVPVGRVMTAGAPPGSVGEDQQWRDVTATGRYLTDDTQLVRKRPMNGANGFWVMTPLQLPDGTVLAVNRGWLAAGSDALTSPSVPPPPAGTVTITGRIRPSQDAPPRPGDLPAGKVTDLDVRAVPAAGPVYPGYVELVGSVPPEKGAPPVAPIPLPELDEGPHLSYAVQWIAFALIAVGGFVLLVRSEARRRAEDEQAAQVAPPVPLRPDVPG
ncbi:MAG TPA: SURF1 family protein [Candidatus Nanopelagicales bacterium]|nr:SURF1 family protein [Candidatus Nanopelagicales bacterium]